MALPHEDTAAVYPDSLASPLQVCILWVVQTNARCIHNWGYEARRSTTPGEPFLTAASQPPLASRQQILIDASNGASDYGNKFGEPLVAGYTRTFGQRLPGGERRVSARALGSPLLAGVHAGVCAPGAR